MVEATSILIAFLVVAIIYIVQLAFQKPAPAATATTTQPPSSASKEKEQPSQVKKPANLKQRGDSVSCGEGCQNEGEKDKGACGESCSCTTEETSKSPSMISKPIRVLFGTQTGTAKDWGERLGKELNALGFTAEVSDMATYDFDELASESVVLFVISTYTDGTPPEKCTLFYEFLKDTAQDFRVHRNFYEKVHYGVFGIGNSIYGDNFNAVAKSIDSFMSSLSGKRLVPVGAGDTDAGSEIVEGYKKWKVLLFPALDTLKKTGTLPTNKEQVPTRRESRKKVQVSEEFEDESDDDSEEEGEPLVDMEDMGNLMKKAEEPEEKTEPGPPKDMLTPSLRKSLTKQGYRLLGSHSGVKLCRWTKAMLRGRGGCYKHTFYGIQSFQCMEMTPSLACANKCVFCWRHHKNPVGKDWKWNVDSPEFLIEEATSNHVKMIKQMKGVPGVVQERFDEAFQIRHCALSLVGEPIIYPHINRFIDLLHEKKISSFLVTNAQFPDKIDSLKPVTQLYISVDAATKESLKRIDRPLFADFWERFLSCIDSLKQKGQRTVFRLTLVKNWNTEEIDQYANLIARGMPTFVEIKGVTFCGTSKASSLTMQNVPFHQEVIEFSKALLANPLLKEHYEISCEHEHSCCILISHKKLKIDGIWHTWIDYEKFHELARSGKEFTALDYVARTPDFAVFGSPERGFDPEEVRFRRNKPYQKGGC